MPVQFTFPFIWLTQIMHMPNLLKYANCICDKHWTIAASENTANFLSRVNDFLPNKHRLKHAHTITLDLLVLVNSKRKLANRKVQIETGPLDP